MSHTKQTPILEYTDAELQSLTVPAGTITHNTTLSCLSYYTGQEWINSDDWESTYDTVSALSASWSEGASTGAILSASSSANNAALIAKTYSTGYTNIDNEHPGNVRGDYAVDLQMDRHPVASDAAPQVAAGTGSVIIGGAQNTISVGGNGLYASVLGGAGNKIGVAQYGVTIGGASNFVGGDEDNGGTANANYSIACGHNARAIHNDVFIYGSSGTSFESKQINTFNINASNGLRFVHDTSDHTGEVLTCIDADGHGKWQSLSADEWNSTYTTTSANSALWSGGGRVKWEDSINKLTIGDLDDDPIGNYAINIQTGRTISTNKAVGLKAITIGYDNRAEGEGCIAIGPAAKSTTDGTGVAVGSVAIGDTAQSKFSNSISLGPDTLANGAGTIAIGNAAVSNGLNTSASVPRGGAIVIGQAAVSQSGYEDIVIGGDAESGLANGGQSVVIGKSAESYGTTSVAIGFDAHTGQSTSITAGAATAIGSRAFAVGDGSVSIGRNVLSYYDETGEIGIYQDLARNPVYTNADRKVGVRFDGSGMVSMSLLSAENAPSTRAAGTDGFENVGELGPNMFNIRRWEGNIYLDANNPANNNILTIPLDSTLGDSAYTTVSTESGNWDSTYTTVSSNSATWANTQQTITSSAGALTLDVGLGQSAITTLTENITSFTIQNASTGDSGVLIISSNGGGWTFPDQNGLGASHIVHTGSPDNVSTLTSATSSAVSIGWYYDGSRHFLYISDPT